MSSNPPGALLIVPAAKKRRNRQKGSQPAVNDEKETAPPQKGKKNPACASATAEEAPAAAPAPPPSHQSTEERDGGEVSARQTRNTNENRSEPGTLQNPPAASTQPKRKKKKSGGGKKVEPHGSDEKEEQQNTATPQNSSSAHKAPDQRELQRMARLAANYPCETVDLLTLYRGLRASTDAGAGMQQAQRAAKGGKKNGGGKQPAPGLAADFAIPERAPRGIRNSSAFCFINSIMQMLAYTPPFVQLALSVATDPQIEDCPVLQAVGKWLSSYWGTLGCGSLAPPSLRLEQRAGAAAGGGGGGGPASFDGSTQQDAQEYLTKLMDAIQQELCALETRLGSGGGRNAAADAGTEADTQASATTEKGWLVVQGKEKLAIREHKSVEGSSRIFDNLFGGTLQSHLTGKFKVKGMASVTLERFVTLPVDIGFAATCTLEEAMERTFTTDVIDDEEHGRTLKNRLRLHRLPNLLLLHIRRWAVTAEGEVVKLDNTVQFGPMLTIPKKVCADATLTNAQRKYRLLSVVCHRGTSSRAGHYVTFLTKQRGGGGVSPDGVLCNDLQVSSIPLAHIVNRETPYFLAYQRCA